MGNLLRLAGAHVDTTLRVGFCGMGQSNSLTAMNRIDDFRIYRRCITQGEIDGWMMTGSNSGGLGTPYCGPAIANTSGSAATLRASSSNVAANNNLALLAAGMPADVFGFFLTSQTQSFIANPGGSTGNLCLGGTIGRYVGPGFIQNSGATGTFGLSPNLTQTPAGPIFVSIAAGETWNFQAWFRDTLPGGAPGSNFTDGLSIDFN